MQEVQHTAVVINGPRCIDGWWHMWRTRDVPLPVFLTNGKSLDKRPRLRSDSYNRSMSRTERLTYTMEWHNISLPSQVVVVSLAKNAPSMGIREPLAADRPRLTGPPQENWHGEMVSLIVPQCLQPWRPSFKCPKRGFSCRS